MLKRNISRIKKIKDAFKNNKDKKNPLDKKKSSVPIILKNRDT
jgi:hypothetical protein